MSSGLVGLRVVTCCCDLNVVVGGVIDVVCFVAGLGLVLGFCCVGFGC